MWQFVLALFLPILIFGIGKLVTQNMSAETTANVLPFVVLVVAVVLVREVLAYVFNWGSGESSGDTGTVSRRNTVKTYIKGEYKDGKGRPVIVVNAPNGREAQRPIEGWTYPGACSWHVVKSGRNEYTISVKDHDLSGLDERK